MKKSLVAIVLACVGLAGGQTAPQPPAQAAASPQQPQQQKKEIKDPAEYNAYVGAVQQQDAAAKISGLEAFLAQYPNSVMKEDALDLLMATYQQAGNQAKVVETANRLLAVNPDNTKALVLLAYLERSSQKWADAKQHAEHGLQALPKMPKPDGVSDADFTKQKSQLSALLNSVAGLSALQLKDYPEAQKYLRAAVEADPNNVENIYPLALAYLTASPSDDVNGLFFIARAANLIADPKGKADVIKFGHSKYRTYHGSDDGWNELARSFADIDNRNVFDGSKGGRPRHRDSTHAKRGKNSPASHSCGTDLMRCSRAHLGCTFGPGVRNLEALAMHAVGAGHAKSLHAPLHGVLHGWRARDSTANLVGQSAKILLDWRGLESGLNDLVGVVVVCGRICGENS